MKANISQVEVDIENLESEISEMDKMLVSPQEYGIDLSDGKYYQKYTECKGDLEKLMTKWENLTQELEDNK